MNKDNLIIGGVLGAGLLGLVAAGTADAFPHGDWTTGHRGPNVAAADFMQRGHGMEGGPGMAGGPAMEGPWHMRGFMHGLNLTDEQRDQVFKVKYEEMPTVHEKMKALRANREALREATKAGAFDAAKVRELANAQGQLMADMIVIRAQTSSKIYALLTPEQKEKMAKRQERRHERREAPEAR